MYSKGFPKEIQGWIDIVEKNIYQCCEDQHLLVAYVKKCFETENIFVDEKQLENYMRMERYLPFRLFEWQKFVFALHNCTYWRENNMPCDGLTCFDMIARGAWKMTEQSHLKA